MIDSVMHSVEEPVLVVEDLAVDLRLPSGVSRVIDGVSFRISAGRMLGIVGESGSGKSMTAHAITRMLPSVARIAGGRVLLNGEDITTYSERELRRIRGETVGMIFQDSLSSLNPLMSVGGQIAEVLRLHGWTRRKAGSRAVELLDLVGIESPRHVGTQRPHELSGGMRQRVMIAIALACNPQLLIADEPTTALDVTIQAEILELLTHLRTELGTAMLLITHDMGVVEQVCDEILVLYGGRTCETGESATVLQHPEHPYTYRLLESVPRIGVSRLAKLPAIPGQPPMVDEIGAGCPFAARCDLAVQRCRDSMPPLLPLNDPGHVTACWEVQDRGPGILSSRSVGEPRWSDLSAWPADLVDEASPEPIVTVEDVVVDYRSRSQRRAGRGRPAVDGVSLSAVPGRALGLVGESGSGKSTLTRAILGLLDVDEGEVTVAGCRWSTATPRDKRRMRRSVQIVFQDPYASLDPRWQVDALIREPMSNFPEENQRGVGDLLDLVGLSRGFANRYPWELSGGQRQRVGIARALALSPDIILADEPVSALDVSVQAQIINVLSDLRDELGVGLIFIAHDLAVVHQIADELAVMYRGKIVEHRAADDVFARPEHAYTKRLLDSIPR